MALSAATVWEVRTTGSDNNGGGFVVGGSGTDRSQQASAQVAIDNATITTSITTNVITFTGGYTVLAGDVDNLVQMLTGTNVTAGFYHITSVNTGAGTWTVDRNVVTSGTTTNATGNMGGAVLTLGKIDDVVVGSNKVWIKSGTYSEGALTFNASAVTPSATVPPTTLIGYDSTRGDIYPGSANRANRPVLQHSSTTTKISCTSSGWLIANLVIEKTSGTMSTCINVSTSNTVMNCTCNDFNTSGITLSNTCCVAYCDIFDGDGASAKGISAVATTVIYNNYIHDIINGTTAASGITCTTGGLIFGNIVDTITGSAADGIVIQAGTLCVGNSIYNTGRDGIRITSGTYSGTIIKGNIIEAAGGYGIDQTTAAWPASWRWDGNAFYNNTSGNRNNIDSTSGVHSTGPYTNTLDKSLSGSPFTNATSGDFTLNSTAGAGADCKATGFPNSYPGLSTVGYRDMGAIQHQDSGGGGTTLKFIPGE